MGNFAQAVASINEKINSVVWGVPALILLIGTGVLMTVLTGFFQFRCFGHMWRNTIGGLFRKDKNIRKSSDRHTISQFQALCTALSATIGTGNIAGVAYAITMGGPGAVFWMWIAAIVGMMTNYSENVLGIYFRRRNEKGEWSGGAMYYLKDGVGKLKYGRIVGPVLAVLFSLFAILASFGIGNMGQVASITESINSPRRRWWSPSCRWRSCRDNGRLSRNGLRRHRPRPLRRGHSLSLPDRRTPHPLPNDTD